MKTYTFAPISAREYPTVKLLDHPYIWGGVQFSLNVSEKPYSPELETAMAAHGIEWAFCPVSEEVGADWKNSFERGLKSLCKAYQAGKKIVVHCDCGNNRSRSFVEALYYILKGDYLPDEYKGEYNHIIHNCKQGHLPSVQEMNEYLDHLRQIIL